MPLESLALLKPRMDSDAAAILSTRDFSWQFGDREGFGGGHLQLGPPRQGCWVREEFVCNPIIEQVAAAILGPEPFLSWYNGNCNVPGSGQQVLHPDHEWAFATAADAAAEGHPWPHRATTINVNFGTADVDSSNGGTEIWPVRLSLCSVCQSVLSFLGADRKGSHNDVEAARYTLEDGAPRAVEEQLPEVYETRRREHPPIILDIPLGAVAFRDHRMW